MRGPVWSSIVIIVGVLLTGFGLPEPSFVPASRLTPAAPDTVTASRDEAERMTVPVTVDGRGPYAFVIDTGADRTVISRELADSLGLRPGDPVELNGTGGVDLTPTARIGELLVGARSLREVSAPTLLASNLGAAGLLGIDSLRDQRMVMDFARNLMAVEPSRRERFGSDEVVVRAHSRYGQLVLVNASVDGVPIAVILDSGAQNTIGNLALLHMIGGGPAGYAQLPVQVVSVSGRVTPARFATVPRVKVGGVRLNNVPVAFADLHTFAEFDLTSEPAMLLGMDVLRHFDRVVVDFGRKEVLFRLPLQG